MTAAPPLLPLRIRLPYATEEEFIEKYGSNVARGGVFVATRAPKPEGTGLAFEFVLADGSRVLRGEGVVVKSQADLGGGRAGMTVRFVRLDARSKGLVDRVVARRNAEPAPSAVGSGAVTEEPAPPTAPKPAPPVEPPPITATPVSTGSLPPPPGLMRRAPTRTPTSAKPPPASRSASAPRTAPPIEPPPIEPPPIEALPLEAPPIEPPPTASTTQPAPAPSVPRVPPNLTGRRATPALGILASNATQTPQAAPPVAPPVTFQQPPPTQEETSEALDLNFEISEPDSATTEAENPPTPVVEAPPPDPTPSAAAALAPSAPAELELNTPAAPAPNASAVLAPSAPAELARNAPAEPAPSAPAEPAPSAAAEPAPSTPVEPVTAQARVSPPDAPAAPTEPLARADVPVPSEEARRGTEPRSRRRALLDVPVSQPAAVQVPDVVLGIDLGTTRARVAVFHEGRAQLVPTGKAGTAGLPSVLAVGEDGQLLVGDAALAEAERSPRHAVFGLKRLLGLRVRSPQMRWLDGLLPFSVVADPRGDASVELRGRNVPLSEFSTLLLRELKAAASTFLGHDVSRAVLCVPAWFNDRQRAALREAGTRAGLTVQRLLNAPAAAALAYGHGRGLARKRVLVVDLGGGGLEAAVVQVTGDDLEVITTGGDPTLGGMEFDARLAEAVASALQEAGAPRPEHPLDWSPLRTAAEAAKVALSERTEAPVPLPTAVPPLSRERLEALTADLVQRVTGVVREVLEANALSPQGLDAVLLVGGQSRAPLVRQRLEESLGVPVRSDVDPHGAVALGAALLGHALREAEAGKPAGSVSEVLTMPLGVAERGGTLRRVLERNTRLPADKTLVLPVTPGPLALALYQGPSATAAENELLGTLELPVERPGEAELHFSLSTDGTVSLAATLPGGKRQPVTLATGDLDEAARDALFARSPLASEPEARSAGLLSGLKKLFGRR